ncbi:L-threonine 3-dehydrogenase [Cucurbitaria berberidis CBS 394.84]|uniref:L-threonine 3-dehydrogenase n=1 Tax=Cucurbitaria berberidis CBS 394.84 TaxID=1168544 RepID=A0A9P4LAJ8_9PLEO|nr:L-threonine 3-dehydrogenase [Cucurbitaria berberidis CBS 394.84]KAF1848120.1 L-threonine 3-dehydrogenase [Cucurbitaria berberidis CBS 394.84]
MGEFKGDTPRNRLHHDVPEKMKALQYSEAEKFAVVNIDVPKIGDDDVLVKISACGVCGTDLHYHKGEFLAKWPLIPGHEAAGTIAAIGKNVKNVGIGDRVAADPLQPCLICFHCTRRKPLLCDNLTAFGGNVPGGFAEYCRYPARLVHPIGDLPDLEAVLVEPAACATHGIERMQIEVGSRVLLFGCGPTGMLLAQLIRMNGAAHLTIASKGGPKLDLAKELGIADSYITISDDQPHMEMQALKSANPYGFDIVVEATGAPTVLEQAIDFVRKGGKLVVYGVYDESIKIAWSPFRIWEHEITILASFCSMGHIPEVIEYVKAGKLKLGGIANKTYRIEEWAECLEAVRKQEVVKAAIVFD